MKKNGVLERVKQLFFDTEVCGDFYKGIMIFIVSFSLLYLAIFGMSHMEGNVFINYIIFGLSQAIGMITSGYLNLLFTDV